MLEIRCSYLLRQGGNLIKGEFIFFVHPGIEEMSPLNLSERGILPGGFTTSSKYYSKLVCLKSSLERINMICYPKLNGLKIRLQKQLLIPRASSLILLGNRPLEYLFNKNKDDELLKEIYDILLRHFHHYCNNNR